MPADGVRVGAEAIRVPAETIGVPVQAIRMGTEGVGVPTDGIRVGAEGFGKAYAQFRLHLWGYRLLAHGCRKSAEAVRRSLCENSMDAQVV